MLPVKVTDSGVLIVRLQADLDIDGRAAAAWAIDGLLAAHRSCPVVLELSDGAVSSAAVSTVVRASRMCADADVPFAVAAPGAEARRALEAEVGAAGCAPRVHADALRAVAALSPLPEVAVAA
ncbi:STAS domain-containing protein [Streptomyces sp. NPDC048352]|uniref:STAS domain-containing protein n=1 Tax=Streptomyces sp. NPDC048352 TaxID=3154718 RepID=UPI00342FB7DD